MTEDCRVQFDVTVDSLGVRIDQQLGRIPASTTSRIPGSVNAESVPLTGGNVGHVSREHVKGGFTDGDAFLAVVVVEEAQFDVVGSFRPHRHVDTIASGRDPEWVNRTGADTAFSADVSGAIR